VPDVIRIGCGGAFAEDRVDWAVELAESGLVEYMGFDCLAERSIGLAVHRRERGSGTELMHRPIVSEGRVAGQGQDPRLAQIVRELAPFLGRGNRVIGNFGAANPAAAGQEVVEGLRKAGLPGTKVGVIYGDDVLDQVRKLDAELPEMGCRASDMSEKIFAANAYIGSGGIVDCLTQGASFVLGGRIADSAVFAAPICFELGWALDDWDRMAQAVAAGHLLECGTHVTGGNFPDPPLQVIPDPWDLSFPYCEVSADGGILIGKMRDKGGAVTDRTVKAQLAYEIHDPAAYLTPDVTADFSQASLEVVGDNLVRLTGITGRPWPPTLRVMVAMDLGWRCSFELAYGGPGCLERARLAEEIIERRLEPIKGSISRYRVDIVGWNSMYGEQYHLGRPAETRVRTAAICETREAAGQVLLEALYAVFGPAAGCGVGVPELAPCIGVTPAFIPRDEVAIETEVLTA
jgi:hypothetical protein